MTTRTYNALFLCTGNSARSILAKSILNRLGKGRIRANRAGSYPKGQVHPLALAVLREHDDDTSDWPVHQSSIEALDHRSLQTHLDANGQTEAPIGDKDS